MQLSFFPETIAIPGLTYLPAIITAGQEQQLLRAIDSSHWITDLKRRVQHYGYRYDYKARNIDAASRLGDLPLWLKALASDLCTRQLFQDLPDQVIVNEYQPGQGIAAHIDCVPCFKETIASLSLGSSCMMDFTCGKEKREVYLEPRSLIVLTGDARYRWMHAIAARKSDRLNGIAIARSRRISLTFRNIRSFES